MENKNSVKNNLIIWGSAGLLLRLAFMPISLHGDIIYIYTMPSFLSFHGIWDIYGYFKDIIINQDGGMGHTYYPPLTYYVIGFFQAMFRLVPGYVEWIGNVTNLMVSQQLDAQYVNVIAAKGVPIFLTAMKMPYLLFDLGCGLILFKYFEDSKDALRAFKLWSVNPIIIFSSYIFGQFSIITTFLLILTIYLIKKQKLELAVLVISCGIMLEFFPIILIPIFLFIPNIMFRRRLLLLFISMIPALLIFVPLYITSDGYVQYAFVSKFMRRAMLGMGLTRHPIIIIGAKIFFMVSYAFIMARLFFGIFNKERKVSSMSIACASYVAIIMLLFLATGYSAIHYLEWLVPILIIFVVRRTIPIYLFIVQMALIFIFNLDYRTTNMMLFMPLNPEYFSQLPSLHEIMNRYFYWGHVITAARLLYSGVCVFIAFKIMAALNLSGNPLSLNKEGLR